MKDKITEFAPAKINLTLHVTGRRDDGYHLLDSLVVFADIGDEITVEPADRLSLTVDGPMSEGVPTDSSNLVLKAASLFETTQTVATSGASLTLTKNLPASSGIGGGSSDAAATLRALSQLWQCPLPAPSRALSLGADLPVCLTPQTQRMSGIGEQLTPVAALPETFILLANPGIEVSTPQVFKTLASRNNTPMPQTLPVWQGFDDFITWLKTQRNDLEAPARAIAPDITETLAALSAQPNAALTRMSGSGATCFALFKDEHAAKSAYASLSKAHPNWWLAHGRILHP